MGGGVASDVLVSGAPSATIAISASSSSASGAARELLIVTLVWGVGVEWVQFLMVCVRAISR
jgi:hypothetical protein